MQFAKPNRQRKFRLSENSRDCQQLDHSRSERLFDSIKASSEGHKKKRRYDKRRSL